MILVDANLLLYAVNSAASQHEAARRWLDATLSGTEEAGFAWHEPGVRNSAFAVARTA